MKTMKVPFINLRKQYENIKGEIDLAIQEVVNSGSFILGANVKKLEAEVASFVGAKFGIGVASGTDALELSLWALGIKEGDEVITTPFSYIATAEAVCALGAKPVFADIDMATYNLDPKEIKRKISKKTKAIIPVHLYGQPCDMSKIQQLAQEYDLKIVEDCAQAIGADCSSKRVGSLGDCGCFSFFPTKNLGGFGDGGMVVTSDDQIAEKLRMLRVHGSKNKYYHLFRGRNSRLDEIQAAVLRVKLKYLEQWSQARIEKAKAYEQMLAKYDLLKKINPPKAKEKTKHIFNLYVIRTAQRDDLLNFLKSKGIAAEIYYPLPLHLQEVYKDLGYKEGDFPNTELAASGVLSLPIYPEISLEEINVVVSTIKEFFN